MKQQNYHNPNDNWYFRYRKPSLESSYRICYYCAVVILIAIAVFLLTGCAGTKYVPVETVRTEYIYRTDTFMQKDSIIMHDSVYIHSKGDTVLVEKWHTRYKDRAVTKTVVDSFIRTDSVQIPYPVEKKLTKWQQLKMTVGGYSTAFSVLFVLIVLVCCLLRARNNI